VPYREGPALLLCPRCGEVLDRVFGGVSACPRCQGAWVTQATLDTAFGNPRWPPGQNLWWHQSLDCPECAMEGVVSTMAARRTDVVMVDLCPSHGLWLDQGELARLMNLEDGSDELLALQKRVSAVSPDPDELAQRRLAWRSELESRRLAAQEFRTWLEQEHRRKQEQAAEAEKQAAIQAMEERRKERERAIAESAAAQQRVKEIAAQRTRLSALKDERVRVIHGIRALDARAEALRQERDRIERELAEAKSRLGEIDAELEGIDLK